MTGGGDWTRDESSNSSRDLGSIISSSTPISSSSVIDIEVGCAIVVDNPPNPVNENEGNANVYHGVHKRKMTNISTLPALGGLT